MKENKLQLSPVQHKFILHWGEMGTRWGINRTVAQIHALLSGENVTMDGQFHSFSDVTSLPRQTQAPHPPICVAALATPEAASVAVVWAGLADGVMKSYWKDSSQYR